MSMNSRFSFQGLLSLLDNIVSFWEISGVRAITTRIHKTHERNCG
jgi:hypothetical protein